MRATQGTRHGVRTAIAASLGVWLCLLVGGCGLAGSSPRAEAGRLDLVGWDFASQGDVALVGTWEICWNQLLQPGDDCPSGWRPVPVRGLWSEDHVESPFGGQGYATYRLRIDLSPGERSLSLAVGGPLTAHRLWIDGVARGGLGVVGRSAETTETGVFNRVYALSPVSGETEIQVQVANFVFRGGGLRRLWYLGEPASVQRGIAAALMREATVFSVGCVVGLAFLALFALRPSEQARGYFGAMALCLGLRAIPASLSTFGELMAPWTTFEHIVRGEYLGTAISFLAALGYAQTKVAGITPPKITRGLQLVSLAFAAIVVVAPMPIVLATLPLQWFLPAAIIVLVVSSYGRAWARGTPGVAVTAATAVLYAGFVVHDIIRSAQSDLGARVELFPYAIVLWILAEAYQLLQGFNRSFEQVEALSDELGEANFELQETEASIVRFVPFDFLRVLGKESIRDIEAGDHARARVSVLYCGLLETDRSSAGADTSAAFDRLNRWVGQLEPLVYHNNGFLNAFAGDGFEAFFPSGPDDAVAAAREMLATARTAAGRGETIDLRIGIDTGWVQLGTLGSGEHLVRGVVGEPVERARRLQRLAVRSDAALLISAETCTALKGGGSAAGVTTTPARRVAAGAEGEAEIEAFEVAEPTEG